jgi:LmbE family N-acetylglucosaminyl deacetylase
VASAPGERAREARLSAREWLAAARSSTIEIGRFRESYFPHQWAALKDAFEQLKRTCEPHLVFTHWREDRHQDHRVVSDLTWNTFRHHTILEYEIPKYDGDLGNPNVYVPLDEATSTRKAATILRCFKSQARKGWFTEDAFLAMLRLRGIECGPRARFAEAFYGRKLVVGG